MCLVGHVPSIGPPGQAQPELAGFWVSKGTPAPAGTAGDHSSVLSPSSVSSSTGRILGNDPVGGGGGVSTDA